MKFTQGIVNSLKAPERKIDFTYWDERMPGFGVRFRGGAGSYVVQYTRGSMKGRVTLGKVSQLSLDEARDMAREQFAALARGVDPAKEKAKEALIAASRFGEQIGPFIKYLSRLDRSLSYVNDCDRTLSAYFEPLHALSMKGEIERHMIAARLQYIRDNNGAGAANNCRAHLHKYFNWAIGEGLADGNPVTGTNRSPANIRKHVPTKDDLVAIWNAAGDDSDYGMIVRLLILMPLRIAGIGNLMLKEINWKDKLLDLPETRNKNGERFLLPIPKRALAILSNLPARHGSEYCFGRTEGGFTAWSQSKKRLDRRLEGKISAPWTHHDFRRAFNTYAIDECGILPHIADICLHHVGEAKSGVKKHYNFANYINEKRGAMEKWDKFIDRLLNDKPELKVIA